jgi:HAD superfamily hydrolase (TIGR01509 family)
MDRINTILFDWDGTLIDTAQYSFAAFQKTIGEFGMLLEVELYEKIYSPNWYIMYEALQLPKDKWQEADDLWILNYGQGTAPLMQGGQHALTGLRNLGYCLGIVTSGSKSRVLREMSSLGVADLISVAVCNEDVALKKPHPEGLQKAMQHLDRRPDFCCYVGDSPDDVEMGRRAHMRTIGIPGGYPGSKYLADANPDLYLKSIDQLLEHFHALR